jgi:beta-N-acetylhexosaminidase
VGRVAAEYCGGLLEGGVIPTLKHFPGLGHVREDTHLTSADLELPVERLEREDWVPYRAVDAAVPGAAWVMLAHLRLPEIDAEQPASTSRAVVQEVVRKKLGLNNVLVTDDLNMRPTLYARDGGIGGSCVRALNAGVDVLLIAWIGENYYPAMAAVLKAHERGELDEALLEQSAERLEAAGQRVK